MDFNLKQWRNQQHESEEQETPTSSAKIPRLHLDFDSASDSALPLFVSEPTTKLSDSTTTTPTKFPRMGSSYFSLGQWQELELQALIYRHFIAGAPVPPELLHLVKKSIITSYYSSHPMQQYPHYQQALMQSGYWGRAAMDPEPGRCRRTDGKKWRCSRDVVAGQKYCERHVHRGRSRSRKPVEIPTPAINGGKLNTSTTVSHQNLAKMAGHSAAAATHFSLSGPSSSIDTLHLNQRPTESKKGPLEAQKDISADGKSSGQILRQFFDDWPSQLQEGDNVGSNSRSVVSATSLSISMPGNPSSDFSLKLSTGGDGYNSDAQVGNVQRSTWRTSMGGGPLAEALRSSTTNSSPTSVLYELSRGSTSEASYIST
ncbi:PREDICTED: growth-regulating factor 3-like [Nicotiana attenuata]|uniref:Growth-regulating factor n=1 Tax=Nicotiana attenuata TaxID=49451 RepID=A0A1J6J7F4_NICAT|nr:PREDICTED: growth-regulating factor 3-like [Nicotiana attenuata]OIT03129.1 growth-regulating factor 3 [Nicotiana attenuata]